MRMNNVHQLHSSPTLLNKLFVAMLYMVFAYTLTINEPMAVYSIFFFIAIVYFLVVYRQRSKFKRFVRYHTMQSFFLNLSLAMCLWLLGAIIDFFGALPGLDTLVLYGKHYLFNFPLFVTDTTAAGATAFFPSVKNILIMCTGLVMAVYAMMGHYTEVPYVSDAARRYE